MKKILVSLLFLISYLGMSQAELNKYKYLIVPVKFDAFKQENQYQTSTLVKYLLVENGFTAVYDNALPADLLSNRCLGLLVGLKDDSSMFTTKVTLTLKDCFSQEVFATAEGTSKEKEFKTAYAEAIKESIKSLSGAGYQYTPETTNLPMVISFKDDVKSVESNAAVIQQKATLEEQSYKNMEPVASNIVQAGGATVLYAQAIANGFQLVDSTPKIKYKMQGTSQEGVFMATGEGREGLILKKEGKWYFEYYKEGQLVAEELEIKF